MPYAHAIIGEPSIEKEQHSPFDRIEVCSLSGLSKDLHSFVRTLL